jgi:hypothetical protein
MNAKIISPSASAVINNKLNEMGTLVELKEIVQVYDNGEMDIRTWRKVFRVLEL